MISILENNLIEKSFNSIVGKFDEAISEEVYSFHKSFPNYKPTPLVDLSGLANHLGVKNIWLKDESFRFDLNAFKVLGASYAVAKILRDKHNLDNAVLSFSIFKNEEL
jgi:diaminopropionate ammonia-lyase